MEIELKKDGKAEVKLGNENGTGGPVENSLLTPPTIKDEQGNKTVTLPSGKIAVISSFKGKHIREAQKIANGEADKLLFAIIALSVIIDGKPVLLEELDEMDGMDVMTLYGQFGTNFTSAPNK